MKKRFVNRFLVGMLGVSLVMGNATPITAYAQENISVEEEQEVEAEIQEEVEAQTETTVEAVTQEVQQDAVTGEVDSENIQSVNASAITEETILRYNDEDKEGHHYTLKYQFRTIDGKKEIVIKGFDSSESNPAVTHLVIPSKISAPNTYSNYMDYVDIPVRSIDQNAFSGLGCPLTVYIPASVESIGVNAFTAGASNTVPVLTELTIEEGSKLKLIGDFAFQNQKNLKSDIVIPEDVTTIGIGAFMGCAKATSITIDGAEEIGDKAFYNCKAAEGDLILPTGLKSIGDEAFSSYGTSSSNSRSKLILPSGLESIGSKAFQSANLMGDLTIPASVDTIGSYAFDGAYATQVDAERGTLEFKKTSNGSYNISSIEDYTFRNCRGFKGNLVIPNTVTKIGKYAFSKSAFDGTLTLSAKLTEIGANAFEENAFVGDLTIPDTVTAMGNNVFKNCKYFNGNLTLSKKLTEIPSSAFEGCVLLEGSIILPTNLETISTSAFEGCENLTGALEMPNTLTKIGDGAFLGCKGFSSLTLSDNITSIGKEAFEGCKGFSNDFVLPENIKTIGKEAFMGCSGFTGNLDMPDTLTSIGDDTFNGMSSLDGYLYISKKLTTYGKRSFAGCSRLRNQDDSNGKDIRIVIPEGTKKLDQDLFYDCDGITTLQLPSTITTISTGVFAKTNSALDVYVYAGSGAAVEIRKISAEEKTFDVIYMDWLYEIVPSSTALEVKVGESVKVSADLKYYRYNAEKGTDELITIAEKDAADELTWTIKNTDYATYSNGKVTGVKKGTTYLNIVEPNTNCSAQCKVKVLAGDDTSSGSSDDNKEFDAPKINVSYRTHIQSFGWEADVDKVSAWKKNGAMSGTSGKAKRLEGINIVVNPASSSDKVDLGIQYTTHCQSYGWLPWSADGDMNGTEGEAKRLEAIMIKLSGADKDDYDVYYRVHAQSYGWLDWAKNGEPSGTAGYAKRLEGIQIVVVRKGESFDHNMGGIKSTNAKAYIAQSGSSPIVNYPSTSNTNPVVPGVDTPNVMYRTHVQSFGWQGWKYNGQMSGTSGLAKRLEGININLTNQPYEGSIVYTTHVQTYGWQGDVKKPSTWKKDGQMSGTSGEAKRLEAICIDLTGEMGEKYDVYYRVHAQSFGWLGWAKNGEESGTAGYAKRLEGIQIVLVPAGGPAPADNYGGITSQDSRPYIQK